MVRRRALPCLGLARASTTTTPPGVTMKPALERPSDPRPVSPSTAYTPSARRRATYGGVWIESPDGTAAARGSRLARRASGVTAGAARRAAGPGAYAAVNAMLTD